MTEIDRLKEELAYEKQIFFLLFAGGLGMLAWLFSNVGNVHWIMLYIAGFGVIADVGVLAFLHNRIQNKIKEIGKL